MLQVKSFQDMTKITDFYELLGIERNAKQSDITAAYIRAVKYWHPDRNKSRHASQNTQYVNVAREVLLDPEKRSEYDRKLNASDQKDETSSHDRRSRAPSEKSKPRDPVSAKAQTLRDRIKLDHTRLIQPDSWKRNT